jgi:chorismate mutase
VLQNAIDLYYSGFMIEVHHDPDLALSDARQQITPDELKILLSSLKSRTLKTDDEEFIHQLELLRRKIDSLDNDLIEILRQRMAISETIGQWKMRNNITILQPDRWTDILTKVEQKALEINLNPEFVGNVFKAIHEESINRQTKIMNNNGDKPVI